MKQATSCVLEPATVKRGLSRWLSSVARRACLRLRTWPGGRCWQHTRPPVRGCSSGTHRSTELEQEPSSSRKAHGRWRSRRRTDCRDTGTGCIEGRGCIVATLAMRRHRHRGIGAIGCVIVCVRKEARPKVVIPDIGPFMSCQSRGSGVRKSMRILPVCGMACRTRGVPLRWRNQPHKNDLCFIDRRHCTHDATTKAARNAARPSDR